MPADDDASDVRGKHVTTMDHAPALIRRMAERLCRARVVVGVTGPVGSGKSTLASRLSGCVISTDHYLPDYERTPEHLRDLPERADLGRLLADLRSLNEHGRATIPQWSFRTHRREGSLDIVADGPLVVVEGLHALHAAHAEAINLRVFVDAPPQVRWARWEHLERTGARGWGVEYAREFFDRVAEPTFARFEAQYRSAADVVVMNG